MELRQGLALESIDHCIRVYDITQYPVIEIYAPLDLRDSRQKEIDWLEATAVKVIEALV